MASLRSLGSVATISPLRQLPFKVILHKFGTFTAPQSTLDSILLSKPWPAWLRQEMRSNWAGETGAVAIYQGCLAALQSVRCPEEKATLEAFAREHLGAEVAHLNAMTELVRGSAERSWMPATSFGWFLGFVSTRFRGARGMYVTTHAVESFVEEHYGSQIDRLDKEITLGARTPVGPYQDLLSLLQSACADEVEHKNHALQFACDGDKRITKVDQLHFGIVYWGSRVGAALAKHL